VRQSGVGVPATRLPTAWRWGASGSGRPPQHLCPWMASAPTGPERQSGGAESLGAPCPKPITPTSSWGWGLWVGVWVWVLERSLPRGRGQQGAPAPGGAQRTRGTTTKSPSRPGPEPGTTGGPRPANRASRGPTTEPRRRPPASIIGHRAAKDERPETAPSGRRAPGIALRPGGSATNGVWGSRVFDPARRWWQEVSAPSMGSQGCLRLGVGLCAVLVV